MNYKVLYRKYRPNNFDEIIGQKTTIDLLKESIIYDKISHAYIFSGPRGTGKTSTAKIFAKTINCLDIVDGNPCDKCNNCLNFKNSADIYEIDAASNNGVDQIRELIDNIKLSPISSRYKVYIIDEVHMLSTNAFNALLLTLEEPPSHVVFILATTNIEDVPITVLSRCQRMDFKKILTKDIKNALSNITRLEKIDITDDALEEIAEYSEGGMRDALSVLDQLSKSKGQITYDTVIKSMGLISNAKINYLIECLENGNIDEISKIINDVRENATDFKTIIKKLINSIKNLAIKIKKNEISSNIGYDNYKRICFELSDCIYKSNINIDSYSLLELILINYINTSPIISQSGQNLKLEKNEEKIEEIVVKKNDNNYFPGNNIIETRINNTFVNASKEDLNKCKEYWNLLKKNVKSKKIVKLLIDTDLAVASKSNIVVKTDYEEVAEELNEELHVLEEQYNKISNSSYKIICISSKKWNIEAEKYKDNIKNKHKYSYIEEPEIKDADINSVFQTEKIEVI